MNRFTPSDDRDPLFAEAKTEIIRAGKSQASFFSGNLRWAKAHRLLDELEAGCYLPGEAVGEKLVTDSGVSDSMDAGEGNVFEESETMEPKRELIARRS